MAIYLENNYTNIVDDSDTRFLIQSSSLSSPAWKAFAGQGWVADSAGPDWITIELDKAIRLWKISFEPLYDEEEENIENLSPGSFALFGSNNGSFYDLIEEFSGISNYMYGYEKDFILNVPTGTAYKYYKIIIYSNVAGGTDTKQLGKVSFFRYESQDTTEAVIRMSKFLPEQAVNLAYASSPEISQDDIAISNEFSITKKDNLWSARFSATSAQSTDKLKLVVGEQALRHGNIFPNTDRVILSLYSSTMILPRDAYIINYKLGTIEILEVMGTSFEDFLEEMLSYNDEEHLPLSVEYQYQEIDVLKNQEIILPTEDILITKEYKVRSVDIDKDTPLYYSYTLSHPVKKPSKLVPFPEGLPGRLFADYTRDATDEAHDFAMPVNQLFYFLNAVGETISLDYKTLLIKSGLNYIVRIYSNIDPRDTVYCCYTDTENVFHKELVSSAPIYNKISAEDLVNDNYDETDDVYAVEENNGRLRLLLATSLRKVDDSVRSPSHIRFRVLGDLDINYSNTNPLVINVGIISSDWGHLPIWPVFDVLKENIGELFPEYVDIINPHKIEMPGFIESEWGVNPSLPEDHLYDYDIIIITGYGLFDLSAYNERFRRYLDQGGTIIIDCPEEYEGLLFELSFGNINPIIKYELSEVKRTGERTLEISDGYSDIWYNFTDTSKLGNVVNSYIELYPYDSDPIDLDIKNIVDVELYAYNGPQLSPNDFTIDKANGLISIINSDYHYDYIDVHISHYTSPSLIIQTDGFTPIINSTISATNTMPLLAVKDFANSGKLYMSALGFISGAVNSSTNREVNKKFIVNLFLYISQRKNLYSPWIKHAIYGATELLDIEKDRYNYNESLYGGKPVTPRVISDSTGALLEKYTDTLNGTGSYRFEVEEYINKEYVPSPNVIINSGKSSSSHEDAVEIFRYTDSNYFTPQSNSGFTMGYKELTGHIRITPFVYYYDLNKTGDRDEDMISIESSRVSSEHSFTISEVHGERDIVKLISVLPPLPGGTKWAGTEYIYYRVELDPHNNANNHKINLFVKDKHTGRYIYSKDGGLVVSHSYLYQTRGAGHIYDDVHIYASVESHEVYADNHTFSIKAIDTRDSKISLPENLNENECWFLNVNNISLSEVDSDTGHVFYYSLPEYHRQPWLYGFPLRRNENELAKYIDRNTISAQYTPIYYIDNKEVLEVPALIEPGVYKTSIAPWNTTADFYLGKPYVIYFDGNPIPFEMYQVDHLSGTIFFNEDSFPTSEEVTIRYAYSNLHIRRKPYKGYRLAKESLSTINKRYKKILAADKKEILLAPALKIERFLADGGGEINPNLYSVDYKAGLITFKEEIEENLIITYAYNEIEDLVPKKVALNGYIELGKDIHFNDTIVIDYYNHSYVYEYYGYRDGDQFISLDLNPTFGHTSTVISNNVVARMIRKTYEETPTYNLIGKELYVYLLPYKVFDPVANMYLQKGYMDKSINDFTVRHTWSRDEYESIQDQYPETKLLGVLKITNNKSIYDVIIMDTRSRGGGLIKELTPADIKAQNALGLDFWDISPYAGVSYNTNGALVIRLPETVLDHFTLEEVDQICQNHLAAGVQKIIKFYKDRKEKVFIDITDTSPYHANMIMPDGSYPSIETIADTTLYIFEDSPDIATTETFDFELEEDI